MLSQNIFHFLAEFVKCNLSVDRVGRLRIGGVFG